MSKRIPKHMPDTDKGSAGFQLGNPRPSFPLFASDQTPRTVDQVIRDLAPPRRVNALLASKFIHRAVFAVAPALRMGRGIALPEARSKPSNGNLIIIRKPTSLQETTRKADAYPKRRSSQLLNAMGSAGLAKATGSFPLFKFTPNPGPQPR